MSLIRREGLAGRAVLRVVMLGFFEKDQVEALSSLHAGDSAFNYSLIIIMFYFLFVMNFIAGHRRELRVSLLISRSWLYMIW